MASNDQSQFPEWLGRIAPLLPLLVPAFGAYTGLGIFLGRLYLESYYSFFGIPPLRWTSTFRTIRSVVFR